MIGNSLGVVGRRLKGIIMVTVRLNFFKFKKLSVCFRDVCFIIRFQITYMA